MDWLDLQFRLRGPWEQFFKSADTAAIREALAFCGADQGAEEESLDAAVRSWVRGKVWPPLSKRDEALLGARFHWVFMTATAHTPAAHDYILLPEDDDAEEATLEYLLIDSWRAGGRPCFGMLLKA